MLYGVIYGVCLRGDVSLTASITYTQDLLSNKALAMYFTFIIDVLAFSVTPLFIITKFSRFLLHKQGFLFHFCVITPGGFQGKLGKHTHTRIQTHKN